MGVPAVVVLPGSRDELVAVVRLLAAHHVPFVPRGAGTGLSGGALADGAAVLLVLTRLNRILSLDPGNRLAVESGSSERSEEHTSELQSQSNLVCRLLLEKKKKTFPRR